MTPFSKHAKYTTKNPVSRWLVKGFYTNLINLYENNPRPEKFIELGCGEGLISKTISESRNPPQHLYAIDIDPLEIEDAKKNIPFCNLSVGSIYNIPFPARYFDFVVCCEVMEHLDDPDAALNEIRRIASDKIILSVPHEPIWRLMNMARFKYLKDFGNTPDHLNHWTRSQFIELIRGYFNIIEIKNPLPWTILLCKTKT